MLSSTCTPCWHDVIETNVDGLGILDLDGTFYLPATASAIELWGELARTNKSLLSKKVSNYTLTLFSAKLRKILSNNILIQLSCTNPFYIKKNLASLAKN